MAEVQSKSSTNTLGILSLVFGILSLLAGLITFAFGAVLGFPALIFAIYAYKKVEHGASKALEIGGIVTSSIASLLALVVIVLMIISFSMQ